MKFEDHIFKGADLQGMDVAEALNALSPDEHTQKREMFRDHFAEIEAALARKVPKVKILEVLAKIGLSLSANTFNKMLDAERERRQRLYQNGGKPDGALAKPTGNDNQEAPND